MRAPVHCARERNQTVKLRINLLFVLCVVSCYFCICSWRLWVGTFFYTNFQRWMWLTAHDIDVICFFWEYISFAFGWKSEPKIFIILMTLLDQCYMQPSTKQPLLTWANDFGFIVVPFNSKLNLRVIHLMCLFSHSLRNFTYVLCHFQLFFIQLPQKSSANAHWAYFGEMNVDAINQDYTYSLKKMMLLSTTVIIHAKWVYQAKQMSSQMNHRVVQMSFGCLLVRNDVKLLNIAH